LPNVMTDGVNIIECKRTGHPLGAKTKEYPVYSNPQQCCQALFPSEGSEGTTCHLDTAGDRRVLGGTTTPFLEVHPRLSVDSRMGDRAVRYETNTGAVVIIPSPVDRGVLRLTPEEDSSQMARDSVGGNILDEGYVSGSG
jgi:hypothetical protein